MLRTLCYISSPNNELTKQNLDNLFLQVKSNNLNLNITGFLIHDNKNFLQIMEGNSQEVEKLFKKIIVDFRHSHIIKIIDTSTNQRVFEDYQTGFEIIDSLDKKNRLIDYLNWLKEAEIDSVDKVIKIVENFMDRKS